MSSQRLCRVNGSGGVLYPCLPFTELCASLFSSVVMERKREKERKRKSERGGGEMMWVKIVNKHTTIE